MYADVIDPVIKVLRETLRLAVQFERTQKQRATLRTVLRKLMVIRELHTTWFVSVTGTQGAGKTKLLQELYGLSGWLDDNAGRGERRPLFIVESDCNQPYASGITAEGVEEQIDRETLTKELRSFSDGERFLLLRLYVPRRHGSPGFGFLLLPGYERLSQSNQLWQHEMRDTLRHSMGSILVTDQTRMADCATVTILDDLMSSCFNNRSPIIAITRTEGRTESERETLRSTAAEVCRVDANEMDRVVCTGVGDAWREQWSPVLLNALKRYTRASVEVNRQRLEDLAAVVDVELEEAVSLLEELVGEAAARVRGQDLLLDGLMKKFRESAEKYRRGLERQLRERSQSYAGLATDSARKQYVTEEEGLRNKAGNFLSGLMLNSSEIEQRFVSRVVSNWSRQGQRTPLDVIYLALSDMASRNLRLGYKQGTVPVESDLAQISSQGMPVLLGYEGSGGAVQLFEEGVDTEQLQNSLRLLLKRTTSEVGTLDRHRAGSGEISKVLELLPTLTMEFMRVAQAAVLAIEPGSLPELCQKPIEPETVMEEIGKGLTGMMKSTKEIMGTILAISAVDIGLDGNLDIATLLTGGQLTGLGAQLSVAAAGIIALGYVGFKVSQAVHQYDTEKKNFIAYCIDNLASQQVEKTLQTYDDVIEQLQDRLTHNLSLAYGIDKELFSERDAMARALYSLKIVRRDLAVETDRAQCSYLA